MEILIEPTADEYADQHRHDNNPAEYADLGKAARHRRVAIAQPAKMTLTVQPNSLQQRILIERICFRRVHAKFPEPLSPLGRR